MILTVNMCTLFLFDSGSSAPSSLEAPVDGDVDLREEEMEQSVFGQESYFVLSMLIQYTFNTHCCSKIWNRLVCDSQVAELTALYF